MQLTETSLSAMPKTDSPNWGDQCGSTRDISGEDLRKKGGNAKANPMSERRKMRKVDPDLELVQRAREGDTAAFDELVVKYTPKLYGLVYHMTSNHDDTNDILQDVFAKAYRALKRFKGKSAFYTWIYSIATNMTLNFLKKRNRRRAYSLDDVDLAIERDEDFIEATSKSDPVREANISELQERLNMAMQQLSDDHRAVVTMFDIQGMPHAEIAKIIGASEGTVRSRLFYAHRQLQTYLDDFRK
ncbi:sigma-70 family RNA polymerase sigma factor [Verrucomicrobiales bacterium]|jgi:RNA polymerase sigma-70 factor (ECF subfamily)|nr:sigma-70 family RNA polymerase sigma factor [Verrucomicrobiales bacterium]MDA9922970.1 sigma-70 family RNA polymerase sigma factor [Verrucomicrobiales bacterium]MDB3941495.1 sigma-70 family RNA polymerase sigma factor [Verrucomicrobiales bacterium]